MNMPAAESRPSWRNRTTAGIAAASFFSDVSHELATAVLPAFLTALGGGPAALGIIEGVADGCATFAKVGGGFAADRTTRRKPLASVGFLITAAGIAAIGVCTSWLQVLGCRVVAWIGRGSRSAPRDVLLMDGAPPEAVGRAFGAERAADAAGAVAGPLLALWMLSLGVAPAALFTWSLAPGLAAFAMIAFVVTERRTPRATGPRLDLRAQWAAVGRPFRRYVGAVFAFGCGDFSRTLLILFATEKTVATPWNWSPAATAVALYVFHNAVGAVAALPIGALADRCGRRATLRVGYALAIATTAGLAVLPPTAPVLLVLFACSGIYVACEEVAEKAVASEMLPPSSKGAGMGVLAAVNGLGDMIASALVGLLWSAFPDRLDVGLWAACGLQVAGAALLARSSRGGLRGDAGAGVRRIP